MQKAPISGCEYIAVLTLFGGIAKIAHLRSP